MELIFMLMLMQFSNSVKMNMKLIILLLINITIVLSGRCPLPSSIHTYPCRCYEVYHIVS